MNLSIGPKWEQLVETVVTEGRYGSASEVVCEGLRLVEEREARLAALRQTTGMASGADGDLSDEDVDPSTDRSGEKTLKLSRKTPRFGQLF